MTLTLTALTVRGAGDDRRAAARRQHVSAIETQVQSFIKLYNTTVEAIQKQLATKPPDQPDHGRRTAAQARCSATWN